MPQSKAPTSDPMKQPVTELGYSITQGANWSAYIKYRPLYPTSLFNRIYTYHDSKAPSTTWQLAHDVGAGCGIVSSSIAFTFHHVIVSDPNPGYVTIVRKALIDESLLPPKQFTFLQEKAERSSVETAIVDLITICEAIHWTDVEVTTRELGRELKPGGTLAVTHYGIPEITGNEKAQRVWEELWDIFLERCIGESYERAFWVVNSGLEAVELREEEWKDVKRVYINAN